MNVPLNEDGSVCVTTLDHIRSIIKEFLPGTESVVRTTTTEIPVDGKNYKITVPVHGANSRDLLIEGFTLIRNRMEVFDKVEDGQLSPVDLGGKMWVDDLIKRKMGGVRDGLKVIWELKEGIFKFDPFTGKLICLK